jgi:hypothetical protein
METSRPSSKQPDDGAQYEKRDVRFKPLACALVGLLVLIAAVGLATDTLFDALAGSLDRAPNPTAAPVEPDAAHELQRLRAQENQRLTTYGWISRQEGIVRIPIKQAMDLEIEQARKKDETAKNR